MPKEKKVKSLEKFRKMEINSMLVHERVMKILDNLLGRLERAMFAGMQLKEDYVNPDHVKAATAIGSVVKELTKLHIQISKSERSTMMNRSIAEKIQFVVDFVAQLPPGYRATAVEKLAKRLLISGARLAPNGRPRKDFVHPMDRP